MEIVGEPRRPGPGRDPRPGGIAGLGSMPRRAGRRRRRRRRPRPWRGMSRARGWSSYLEFDGLDAHEAAWKGSAAYKLLE